MHTTNLRKVGGSTMLAVPPPILKMLGLKSGSRVTLAIEGQRLVIEQAQRPSYSLNELLDQCAPDMRLSEEEQAWIDSSATGRELI